VEYYTSTTEFNCGIDLHSRQMYVCVMDKQGQKLVHRNIKGNSFEFFLKLVAPYRHDLTVVCESTFSWYWLHDACSKANIRFVLAHALYLKHIHGGKNKNDRIDSEKLASLLRANLIPPAYVYPSEMRPIRALLRQRMSYVQECTRIKTRLWMCQAAEGLIPATQSKCDVDGWEERIVEQFTNPLHKFSVACGMDMVRAYSVQIKKLEAEINRQAKAKKSREYYLLKSAPGIGPIMAMTILFEVDDINRFPTVKDFLSYCRLVKGSVASAGKVKGMTGAKMGNANLRWAFGEVAVLGKNANPLLRTYAEKIISKRGKFKGNAILANKIARAVYFMLQKGTAFDVERVIATSI
jgi:transposase